MFIMLRPPVAGRTPRAAARSPVGARCHRRDSGAARCNERERRRRSPTHPRSRSLSPHIAGAPTGAVAITGVGTYDTSTGSLRSNGLFRCTDTVGQGPPPVAWPGRESTGAPRP